LQPGDHVNIETSPRG